MIKVGGDGVDALTARPEVLKQANLSVIRRLLKTRGTATRAEIAEETGISSTTVRALLAEMLERGELESAGYDASSGGRKAERYRFRPDRYHGAAVCMTNVEIHGLVVDSCGEIVEIARLEAGDGDFERAVVAFLDRVTAQREIRAIGLGVPGVVDGRVYWKKRRDCDELYQIPLGELVARRYGVSVVLENDLKAVAIGFGRCYEKEFPQEEPENTNMAYLQFEEGCVSAGFISGGRIVQGSKNFAGELGLVPIGGTLLDDWVTSAADDAQYIDRIIQIVSWVCAILNPQYVALGGPDMRRECIGPIGDGLSALLPRHMQAEILYAPDMWHDYHDGMAYLTANKLFDEVQFVKE